MWTLLEIYRPFHLRWHSVMASNVCQNNKKKILSIKHFPTIVFMLHLMFRINCKCRPDNKFRFSNYNIVNFHYQFVIKLKFIYWLCLHENYLCFTIFVVSSKTAFNRGTHMKIDVYTSPVWFRMNVARKYFFVYETTCRFKVPFVK